MTAEGETNELSLVQLGDHDVDPKLLVGPGTDIEGAISARVGEFEASPAFVQNLPASGWRRIATLEENRYQGCREVIAAPCTGETPGPAKIVQQQVGAAWAVAALDQTPDHRWTINAYGCLLIQAGRPTRRRNLRLSWPTPSSAWPADQPPLPRTVELSNVSDQPWSNDTRARRELADGEGHRLPTRPVPRPSQTIDTAVHLAEPGGSRCVALPPRQRPRMPREDQEVLRPPAEVSTTCPVTRRTRSMTTGPRSSRMFWSEWAPRLERNRHLDICAGSPIPLR